MRDVQWSVFGFFVIIAIMIFNCGWCCYRGIKRGKRKMKKRKGEINELAILRGDDKTEDSEVNSSNKVDKMSAVSKQEVKRVLGGLNDEERRAIKQRRSRQKEAKKRCCLTEFMRLQRVRGVTFCCSVFVGLSTCIQIARLVGLANVTLSSYKVVDCSYSVFLNSVVHGFKDNTNFDVLPRHRKFLGLNGYKFFATQMKKNLGNIRSKGGFDSTNIFSDSQ